jgi:hypothetical protein
LSTFSLHVIVVCRMNQFAPQFLTLFSAKVRQYNLLTNSQLPFDLQALKQVLSNTSPSSSSSITYHDKHPYTEIRKCVAAHVVQTLRKQLSLERIRLNKSMKLSLIHQHNLSVIHLGDHFTCEYQSNTLIFCVMEITESASLRLRQFTCAVESNSHPILSNPQGFIVRVSQDGHYRLRIDATTRLWFRHEPLPMIPCLWLWSISQNPLAPTCYKSMFI